MDITQENEGHTESTETEASEPTGRQIGGEALVNRVFREVALTYLGKAGVLAEAREQFVAIMAGHESARRTDKVYAQKYADDMATRLAMQSPPVIVPPAPPLTGMSQSDVEDLFAGLDQDGTGSFDDLVGLAQPPQSPLHTLMAENGPMAPVLRDFLASSKEHPFVRVVSHQGQRYVALGTIMGTVLAGKNAGERINSHMTVVPHRRFRDVPEEIAPKLDGRQLSLEGDVPGSTPDRQLRKFLFVIRHQPGLKVRWWVRLGDKDLVNGVRRIVLTDDAVGYRTDLDPARA